jgi:energy-converting hydrogenase Eha subunit E
MAVSFGPFYSYTLCLILSFDFLNLLLTCPPRLPICLHFLFVCVRAGLSAAAEPSKRGPLAQVLTVAVKAVALLGLLAVSCGPFYSYTHCLIASLDLLLLTRPPRLPIPLPFSVCVRAGLSAAAEPSKRGPLAQVLTIAVKAVALLGLLAVSFGPFYSYTLLRIVYSQRWSETEAPFVLGCYTAYLLLLAVNGEREMMWMWSSSLIIACTRRQ